MIEIRLKELLRQRDKTFYWLAKQSGVAHRTLWRLKTGNAEAITLEVLDKVCRALDCQPGDLLIRINEEGAVQSKKKFAHR